MATDFMPIMHSQEKDNDCGDEQGDNSTPETLAIANPGLVTGEDAKSQDIAESDSELHRHQV